MAGLNLGGRAPLVPPQQKPEVKVPVADAKPDNESEVIARAPQAERIPESIPEDDEVVYSVYPLNKFSIGSTWVFDKGVMKVTREESVKVDAYLAKADHQTRNMVKKIDRRVADALVRNLRPVATKTFDSSTFSEGRHEQTEIGTQDIAKSQAGQGE